MAGNSRLRVDRTEPFLAFVFFRKDSRRAGEALLTELRAKGRMTEKEMSQFVKRLAAGDLGFRFSKTNFYKGILGRYLDLGFVKKGTIHGGEKGKTVNAYLPVLQPIPAHAPDSPSFWSVAYQICLWWNDIMFPEDRPTEQEQS